MPSKTEIGHSHDENHVSSTSSSCLRSDGCNEASPVFARAFSSASPAVGATTKPPWGRYQAGMRWPHHNWREMHQSLMFSIQWR